MGKWKKGIISTARHNGEDYTNRQIAGWTVLGLAYNSGAPRYRQVWRCRCVCGTVQEVNKENVLFGRSVGCSHCVGERHKGKRNHNWKGSIDIPSSLFTHLKYGAKVRGIKVQITIEDLQHLWEKSNGVCALSGLPITVEKTASLDRIDSNLPYTISNIQWVHKDIQLMKNYLDQRRFIELCQNVSNNNKG
jgi:hypothetical protein